MAASDKQKGAVLTAKHVLEFAYTRSVGPVLGRFLAGLRDGRILGLRTPAGQVLVPPMEFDPASGAPLDGEFVEVGPAGVVTAWSWAAAPRKHQPLDRPFAWALIRLDGADTPLLHAVDAGDAARMKTGLRVRVRWREQRTGMITDIACFEPQE